MGGTRDAVEGCFLTQHHAVHEFRQLCLVMAKRYRLPKWIDGSCRCSFCGKAASAVGKLIAGPGVYICDECVGLCIEIMEENLTPSR